MHLVIFLISCFKEFSDKAQKALVLDSFTEYAYHDFMVNVVEKALNVPFDKPFAPGESVLNHSQCGVAAPVRPETVGGVLKTAFIDCFQQHSDDLLYQLVIYGWYSQRSEFSVLFRDIRSP